MAEHGRKTASSRGANDWGTERTCCQELLEVQLRVPSMAGSSMAAVEVTRPFSELQKVMRCLAWAGSSLKRGT